MKEKLKNKKVVYTIIGIVSVLLVMLAVTYAYWLVTKTQDKENEITAACLDIAISGEKNDIELTNQFPMSDEDGMKLVPYEFTVTNNCNTSVDYQVALEATGTESSAMATSSLKVALNDTVTLLSENAEVDATISGSYESRKLLMGTLAAKGNEGSSVTYELRIWIDENAPISEMNKTFKSKISVTIGQGISNIPYEEGTLAYDIILDYAIQSPIIELDGELKHYIVRSNGSIYIGNEETEYENYGTEYTFNETTRKYKLSGTVTRATLAECRNGTKMCGKYTLTEPFSEWGTLYEVTDFRTSGHSVTGNVINYRNQFTLSSTGLYKMQDDLGDSYYFKGEITNNYVKFGSYNEDVYTYEGCYDWGMGEGEECYGEYYPSLEACEAVKEEMEYSSCKTNLAASEGDPMYWRIVRINGDGTIRLVYDGITAIENGWSDQSKIGTSAYNNNADNAKYIGYTYDDGTGTQVDSTVKDYIDTWYENHLKNDYGKYIADGIFCNDRTISSVEDSGKTYYAAYQRLHNDRVPSLKCTNKNDRYTVNDTTNGNGLLSNPIGLITADEVELADTYLTRVNEEWTMTPAFWADEAHVYEVVDGDTIYEFTAYTIPSIRPVINLKADVKFTGDGAIDNPYKIVTE